MRPVLGIELGPARCVLVLVDDRRGTHGTVHVAAHHVVQYEDPVSLANELRRLRVQRRLPRRARVVVWPGSGDSGVTPADKPAAAAPFAPSAWRLRERLRPIVRAGFRVSGALTPAQAVASLASLNGGPAVAAGLAVDERGGALAVVRGESTLLARELAWKIPAPPAGAALVDRYAFVSQVVPHLGEAMAAVRRSHAARVERVVLCGPAPGLRTLAAPLIEELDVEVETLDGPGVVTADGEADEVALVQLAAGAAIAPPGFAALPRPDDGRGLTAARLMLGAAAAAAVIVLVLLFWPAPQASTPRRPAAGAEGSRDASALQDVRSAFLGESCARKSVSA